MLLLLFSGTKSGSWSLSSERMTSSVSSTDLYSKRKGWKGSSCFLVSSKSYLGTICPFKDEDRSTLDRGVTSDQALLHHAPQGDDKVSQGSLGLVLLYMPEKQATPPAMDSL